MSTGLILGIASIFAMYNIIIKLIALKEWDMKEGQINGSCNIFYRFNTRSIPRYGYNMYGSSRK